MIHWQGEAYSTQTIALMAENDEVIPKKHSLRLINEFPPGTDYRNNH
ncbi:MAG: hypothetical protein CM1200mP30_24040 [Pseudomonadota bacterium]|nr:MAG: hypothetical protein CM1200mP30_24040 [Pseudomonadota bacterium]